MMIKRYCHTDLAAAPIQTSCGQSMVELLVILPVMLLLIFGTIQFALIYHAKITLNYAAYEGVRAGTLNCNAVSEDYSDQCNSEIGQYDAVKEGFARGLAPLYSYFEPDAKKRKTMDTPAGNQVEAFQQGRQRIFTEFESEYDFIRIERLNPTEKAFADFAVDDVIPNDNLKYRTRIGGASSETAIQDANLLHLRFTYWYPLYVPFINRIMFDTIICCKGVPDSFDCKWAQDPVCSTTDPRIPITSTAVMRMQTPVENSNRYYSSDN